MTVMSQVRKLVAGQGITYVQWPDHVVFCPNRKVTLEDDFEALLEAGQKYTKKYGEDKGHGWLLRHPLNKLRQYQAYLRLKDDSVSI